MSDPLKTEVLVVVALCLVLLKGEYLLSLATLMGVPPERQPEFFRLAQELFGDMMQRQRTSDATVEEDAPRRMLIALQEGMRMHFIPSKALKHAENE